MRRYFDKTTRVLQKQRTASPVLSEEGKQNSAFVLELQVVEAGLVIELDAAPAAAAVGRLTFKQEGKTDLPAFVVQAPSMVKTGTGANTVYTFTVALSSAALTALITANPYGVTLVGEIEITYADGTLVSLNPFQLIVHPAVARGYETPAVIPNVAVEIPLNDVTRLTGGVSPTDLDAVAIAPWPAGTKFSVVIDKGGEVFVESTWQKRAGTAATNLDSGIIRTLDHHAVNNPHILVRVSGD